MLRHSKKLDIYPAKFARKVFTGANCVRRFLRTKIRGSFQAKCARKVLPALRLCEGFDALYCFFPVLTPPLASAGSSLNITPSRDSRTFEGVLHISTLGLKKSIVRP